MVLALVAVGCSSTKSNINSKKANSTNYTGMKLSNFDQVSIPNNSDAIAKMIAIVQPELDPKIRSNIASNIQSAVTKYKVEPQIIVALIDTESNFKAEKVSTTGDLSIAQVNMNVWNQELKRLKLPLIKKEELIKKDQKYAIHTMAHILSILKKRHAKQDRRWYARYHSNTKKYKNEYLKRIEVRMKMLDSDKHYILAKNSSGSLRI